MMRVGRWVRPHIAVLGILEDRESVMSHGSGNGFVVEGLEGRTLLSASVAADLLATSLDIGVPARQTASAGVMRKHVRAVVGPTAPLTGAFNVAGTFTHVIGPGFNPDAGNVYHFEGSGRKRSLGSFTMTGDVHGLGFIASGRERGYVTLTSSQGTIDLRLLGPDQTPGSLAPSFAFKIVGGTGAYAQAYGKGSISVSASDTTQRFVFRFNQ
jgi:hypothetical protein